MFKYQYFNDRPAARHDKNSRANKSAYACHQPEFFYFGQPSHKSHGKKIDGAGDKENDKVKDSLKGAVQGKNVGDRQQKRRTDIDAHEKSHDHGATVLEFAGGTGILLLQ